MEGGPVWKTLVVIKGTQSLKPRSNSMAFVTSQLVTLGMIEQPV